MAEVTFSQQIASLAARVGKECDVLHSKIGDVAALETDDKESLVIAVNEVKKAATSLKTSLADFGSRLQQAEINANASAESVLGIQQSVDDLLVSLDGVNSRIEELQGEITSNSEINDGAPSTIRTYSSSKIEQLVSDSTLAVKDDLLNSTSQVYETLKELNQLLEDNADEVDALKQMASGYVKFDAKQELNTSQQSQARTNIGAGSALEVLAVKESLDEIRDSASKVESDLAGFKTNVGNTSVDLVAAFDAAMEEA